MHSENHYLGLKSLLFGFWLFSLLAKGPEQRRYFLQFLKIKTSEIGTSRGKKKLELQLLNF
jgi:hypothetical protein